MTEGERRRGTDPLIIEMHGMLSTLVARFDDHVKDDEKAYAKLEKVTTERLPPLEEFHGSMKTAGKVFAVAGTPALLGIGAAIWAWFKGIIFHAKVNP